MKLRTIYKSDGDSYVKNLSFSFILIKGTAWSPSWYSHNHPPTLLSIKICLKDFKISASDNSLLVSLFLMIRFGYTISLYLCVFLPLKWKLVKHWLQNNSLSPQEIHNLVAKTVLHYPHIYSFELFTLSIFTSSD